MTRSLRWHSLGFGLANGYNNGLHGTADTGSAMGLAL